MRILAKGRHASMICQTTTIRAGLYPNSAQNRGENVEVEPTSWRLEQVKLNNKDTP
jgi:hypothetical protein